MLVFLFLVSICNSFIPRSHPKGRALKISDLGPRKHYQHIKKFFGNTLYNSESSKSIIIDINANESPLITPIDFGADPTGLKDSTYAFEQAISKAITYGNNNSILAFGVKDCGGVTIDLQGGDYTINKTLIIPTLIGNLRMIDGTIRASNNFNKSNYLLQIGEKTCDNSQYSCNENIGIENMMFDCRQVCYGGIYITYTMGAVFGPQLFFLGFTGAGITIVSGHETMIMENWLGEYLYSDSRTNNASAVTATGIQLFGNDHYITNTIVYSSLIGVDIAHPANLLTGVHTWNTCGDHGDGCIGIRISATQNRLIGCYLDYNRLVVEGFISTLAVHDSFFLGSNLVLRTIKGATNQINSFSFFDNSYWAPAYKGQPLVELDETNGKWIAVNNMYMQDNMAQYDQWTLVSTKASETLTMQNSDTYTFDFSKKLIFADIAIKWIDYSVKSADGTIVKSVATQPSNLVVTITTDIKCDCTVYVTVDQSSNLVVY